MKFSLPVLVAGVMLAAPSEVLAQQLKIGYVNLNGVL
jgi:hypothetical protein